MPYLRIRSLKQPYQIWVSECPDVFDKKSTKKSTKNQPKINQKINQKSTKNQPKINQKSTKNQPIYAVPNKLQWRFRRYLKQFLDILKVGLKVDTEILKMFRKMR
jgi:hypothetical protein